MEIIKKVQTFLQLFMTKTLAVRLISMILIAAGVPNKRVTEMTGLCDKSVRELKKSIEKGEIEKQFSAKGGGRRSKLKGIEKAVEEEIEKKEYHSQQQIADMIEEKFGIKISRHAVGKLLKKTGLSG